jgi:hypothetical protein
MERLADPHRWGGLADLDENDPASMARMVRQMGPQFKEAMGEEYPGEIDQMIEEVMEEAETGQDMDTSETEE